MKILVPCKRVPDPDQKIRVTDDGTRIDSGVLSFVLNPFDAIAVEEALRIKEGPFPDAEIVAVGIMPPEGEPELRSALAMGVDRALLVGHEGDLDPWNVARTLAAIVKREQPEIVLMGKQAVDDDSNQTGQFLAAILGWPQATFASQLEFTEDALRVHRETDLGIEVIRVGLPAVVTSDLRLNEPRYASLPSIMRARKKAIEENTLTDLGIELEPRVKILNLEGVSSQRQCEQVGSAPELIAKLRAAELIS